MLKFIRSSWQVHASYSQNIMLIFEPLELNPKSSLISAFSGKTYETACQATLPKIFRGNLINKILRIFGKHRS